MTSPGRASSDQRRWERDRDVVEARVAGMHAERAVGSAVLVCGECDERFTVAQPELMPSAGTMIARHCQDVHGRRATLLERTPQAVTA